MTIEELEAANKDLQAKLAEASKGGLGEEERKRLSYLEDDHKKLIADRDAAKEAKRAAEEKRLAEQGEFKTLAEQRAADLAEATKGTDELKAQLAKYAERDAAERAELIEKVPEHLREDITDTTPLALIKKLTLTKDAPAGYRPPGDNAGDKELTSTQRIAKGLAAGL